MKTRTWIFLIVIAVVLFYWKLVFTKQFSILWQWEPVTQSYSWYHFAASAIHRGVLPLWDPYRFSGNTFIGEMQTGLFYPLKFFAYVMPFDSNGMFSERVYNYLYVVTHILAAIFTYLLVRYIGLSSFSSFVAGLSFSLGGYLGNTGHPHTLDSGIWLPLIVLFFLKSTDEELWVRSAFYAALGGLAMGMAILGGGIHMVIMDGIVIASMFTVMWFNRYHRTRAFAAAAFIAVMAFMFGAIQLLPSMEYSPLSYRWVGGAAPIRGLQKVPYQYIGEVARFSPRSIFTFLFGGLSPGDFAPGNYAGVLPFLLSIIGAWRCWREKWVKYFVALGLLSFVYTWGSFSFLHGLLYLLPGLDVAREAARFILLTHFAISILAAYGLDHVLAARKSAGDPIWIYVRGVRWLVVLLAILLVAGSLQNTIAIDDKVYLSFVFIGSAYVLLELMCRNYQSNLVKIGLVFFLLWDLNAFAWMIRNKGEAQAQHQDYMAELQDNRKLADFFKSQPGVFRVHFDGEFPPNIGDVYGVEMTGGMSATMLTSYLPYLGHPQMAKLLNVRYTMRRTDLPEQAPVFKAGEWRVYENPAAGDRAWLVHQVEIDKSNRRPLKQLDDLQFDPARTAILETSLSQPVDAGSANGERVQTLRDDLTSLEFQVDAGGRGLLVLGEVFYPGWSASVNGRPEQIYRVDGFLRGLPVPAGRSTVRLEYRPRSVQAGFGATVLALIITTFLGMWSFRHSLNWRI